MIYLLCLYTMFVLLKVIFITLDLFLLCASINVTKLKNLNLLFETDQIIKKKVLR
jgi:hypothetical protein